MTRHAGPRRFEHTRVRGHCSVRPPLMHVALTSFANVSLPRRVAGFTWNQVHLLLGFQALVMMLCFLIRDKSSLSFGVGFALMFIASIGLMVGAIMRDREPASTL